MYAHFSGETGLCFQKILSSWTQKYKEQSPTWTVTLCHSYTSSNSSRSGANLSFASTMWGPPGPGQLSSTMLVFPTPTPDTWPPHKLQVSSPDTVVTLFLNCTTLKCRYNPRPSYSIFRAKNNPEQEGTLETLRPDWRPPLWTAATESCPQGTGHSAALSHQFYRHWKSRFLDVLSTFFRKGS